MTGDIIKPIYGEAWASSGEKLSPTEIKVQSGWVQEMMPYQWENFLQNRQDTALLELLQKGVPEWSVDQEYLGNKSIVTYNGYTYQAKSTNTGNLPTDSAYWKRTSPNVTDSGIVTLGSGGTGATNATDARNNLELGTAATVSADTIVFKSVTGNAPAADKWTSPISLSLSGGATGSTSLDGSGNATISVSGLNASSISSGTVPSVALSNATLKTSPTGSTVLASGATSERDLTPQEGYTRWNKTTKVVEVFNGTSWVVNTSQSEAYLLDRTNHTGVQPISTVSGLQAELVSKLPISGGVLSGNLTVPSLNGGQIAGMRNKIINGKMEIAQRGTSFPAIVSGSYSLDRWQISGSTDGVASVSQQADAPGNNEFQYSLRCEVATADTSIDAPQVAGIAQAIEGYSARDLIGRTFTLSFWVRSSKTGTHCVSFRNATPDSSYVTEYTINAANTWEQKSITVHGGLITVGAWNWTNGVGLSVYFTTASGSNYQTTPCAWQVGSFLATTNQVNCLDTVGNIFAITGVQLEVGEDATPFEHRPYGVELALCQRYYQKIQVSIYSSTSITTSYTNRCNMRASPSLTYTTGYTQGNPDTLVASQPEIDRFRVIKNGGTDDSGGELIVSLGAEL